MTPVVVSPPCVDSHLGNAATYLSVDVPDWIRTHPQVDPDPRAWAVGMDVHLTELPDAHSFAVWSAGLEKELPWLGHRLGLDTS